MGFSCGIVGLPNSGKSTIFNALTSGNSPVAPYPFCTIEPREGQVSVPDARLATLGRMCSPEKLTPSHLVFVDIAGLVAGASKGEGLGNRFLAHIREMDVICYVLRLFQDENVSHVAGRLDPLSDLEVLQTELILADLESIERKAEKDRKAAKVGDKAAGARAEAAALLTAQLEQGNLLSSVPVSGEIEAAIRKELFLLTCKPAFVIVNIDEGALPDGGAAFAGVAAGLKARGLASVPVCGKLEMELSLLDLPQDRADFMGALGLTESALERVVVSGYGLLDLCTFYTLVGKEIRAWAVPRETPASRAAGRIHTDMENGFIKAEIMTFADFVELGSEQKVRDRGLVRIEGRDYLVQDGDIVRFAFRA